MVKNLATASKGLESELKNEYVCSQGVKESPRSETDGSNVSCCEITFGVCAVILDGKERVEREQ